jgi:hypothetical protein
VHAPGTPEAGALAGQVALGQVAVGDQPLRQAGVEAAGDRVFVHADRRGKGAHLQVGFRQGLRVMPVEGLGLPARACYQLNSIV